MRAIPFAVLAGLCWGIGELCTKHVLSGGKIGPITAITVRSTVALPVLWLAYLIVVRRLQLEPTHWMQAGRSTLLLLILGSGLVAGAAAMIFYYSALNLGEISTVKPIAFTIAPAVAVLLGWVVLGESMSWRKAAAVALILLGVLLLTGGTHASRSASQGARAEPVTGAHPLHDTHSRRDKNSLNDPASQVQRRADS